MKKQINVGLVGASFMGRAHSNAYLKVASALDPPVQPVRRAACDINPAALDSLAARYEWQTKETSWERLIARDDIDLIDICTANDLHMPIALAAAQAGKHVLCEKPLARNADEARRMRDTARAAGVRHMVAFNYRRVPALALAKELIEQGKIGRRRQGRQAGFRRRPPLPVGVGRHRRIGQAKTVDRRAGLSRFPYKCRATARQSTNVLRETGMRP